jgi:hypothetical protein
MLSDQDTRRVGQFLVQRTYQLGGLDGTEQAEKHAPIRNTEKCHRNARSLSRHDAFLLVRFYFSTIYKRGQSSGPVRSNAHHTHRAAMPFGPAQQLSEEKIDGEQLLA